MNPAEPPNTAHQVKQEKARSSELVTRVISSLALAMLALVSAWFGGYGLIIVWSVAALAVLSEWFTLVGVHPSQRILFWGIGALGILFSAFSADIFGLQGYFMFLPTLVSACVIGCLALASGRGWAWPVVGPFYASIVVLAPLWLRGRESDGLVALLWLFLVVWISDIGAYFVGRKVGGPKLWPAISPKKTWAGLVGGLVFGTVVASVFVVVEHLLSGPLFLDGMTLIGLTFVTSLVSEAGDLFESGIKRHFGAKDSGHLIPGHGGIMDRLDSFVAAGLFAVIALDFLGA